MRILYASLVLVVAATPALAKDRLGYQAIAAGDLTSAEQTLTAERRIFSTRPEVALNLAAVYARTGRTAEARDLYDDILARDAVDLERGDGSVRSSHDLARAGLTALTPTLVARR